METPCAKLAATCTRRRKCWADTLNASVSGSGQIGTLDTTTLQNGEYWIELDAISTSGTPMVSLELITVVGDYKPGRITTSQTDLVVPATGLAIRIDRRYDSLKSGQSGDFGFGWSLGTTVDLEIMPRTTSR